VALGLDGQRHPVCWPSPVAPVILLDTNALIWLEQRHPRARSLATAGKRLYISPASILELQFLLEAGWIRLKNATVTDIANRDDLWTLDDPPAARWFEEALDLGWTRDPFDRLIVAHARLRGWRLATGDAALLERLSARESVPI
jgi:PIN domain nuclease of toxin-antitoxin system